MPTGRLHGRQAETLQDREHRGQFHPVRPKSGACENRPVLPGRAPGQDQAVALGSQAGHLEPVSSGVGWCRLLLVAKSTPTRRRRCRPAPPRPRPGAVHLPRPGQWSVKGGSVPNAPAQDCAGSPIRQVCRPRRASARFPGFRGVWRCRAGFTGGAARRRGDDAPAGGGVAGTWVELLAKGWVLERSAEPAWPGVARLQGSGRCENSDPIARFFGAGPAPRKGLGRRTNA